MRGRDFLLLALICLVWALSNVLGKIVVDDWAVPPVFFSAVRFALVALVTLPWLLPLPRPFWPIALIALLLGGGNFALLYAGLQTASPSAAAIVLQLGVPFTTILSVIVLRETIHWRRGIGIALTLAGVLVASWRTGGLLLSYGLWLIAAAAFAGSVGAVLMKRVDDVPPLRFQAWVGLTSAIFLSVLSAAIEVGQWQSAAEVGWPFVAAIVFTALIVSVGAHTAYYHLIARYEANLLAPLTLMTPMATIALGVAITGDLVDSRMMIGAAIALTGVALVAVRPKAATSLLLEREQR